MDKANWISLVLEAVQEARRGDRGKLDLLAAYLAEADQAKQALRDRGYGWTGLGLLETIQSEVPTAAVIPGWPPNYETKNGG